MTNKTANARSRGESDKIAAPSGGLGVSVIGITFGVIVTVAVVVEAGKIKVIAGSGARVVVGVIEGVSVGVPVGKGVP